MAATREFRAHDRLEVRHQVRVNRMGSLAACGVAINLSLGGILFATGTAMPLGSRCEVEMPLPAGSDRTFHRATGQVVRSDGQGTAIAFFLPLGARIFDALVHGIPFSASLPFLEAYSNYFRVSFSPTHEGCEALLGIRRETFQRVFLTSLLGCSVAALVPAWLLRDSLQALTVWGKAALSIGYGALWFGAIQPTVNVLALSYLRSRSR